MHNIKLKFGALTLAVIVMAAFAGCSSDDDDVDRTLTGGKWSLLEYRVSGTLHRSVGTATILFETGPDVATGSTGCNTYGGDYSVDGNSLSIGSIVATEIGCVDPPGVMDQEREFLRILSAVTRFEIDDNRLRLISTDGELVFAATIAVTLH